MTRRKALTEADWLASDSVDTLLTYLRQHRRVSRAPGSRRRFRLFACACCRRQWPLFTDEQWRRAVEVAELAADGQAGKKELAEAHQTARALAMAAQERVDAAVQSDPGKRAPGALLRVQWVLQAAEWTAFPGGGVTAVGVVYRVLALAMASECLSGAMAAFQAAYKGEESAQADLFRDVFGNPFHPGALDSEWLAARGSTVIPMARTIYAERQFHELPILADALEEAGCPCAALVQHCRSSGSHTRGCWAVDALLTKA
jgi:hypothetical protein